MGQEKNRMEKNTNDSIIVINDNGKIICQSQATAVGIGEKSDTADVVHGQHLIHTFTLTTHTFLHTFVSIHNIICVKVKDNAAAAAGELSLS